ncbi:MULTISPECIES: GerAB/ArcD/ProY family transporter [Paenibacillus]|uniref:GerAB/ArcD/ProY family transporter n=1 Tax=Paenibacillus TaxID=44249 RepID=UPI0022B8E3AC|nr:endospore germination permease [Paenibacillus caseinilyticus]MCZ8521022.1 endospore germination permease [Paenibacillus caseinilyticus]
MKKKSQGKLGTREFTSLLLLAVGLKLSDTTPTLLLEKGETAGWIIPLLAFVPISISLLVLLSVLRKYPDKGLMELISELAGKYGGVAIGLILFVATLASTALESRSYVDIVNTMVYQRTPIPALYLMMMLAAYYVANRGFEAIGRTAWIIIPYIEIAVLMLVWFVYRDVDWLHLFPIAGPGGTVLVKESMSHISMYREIILLTAFIPFAKSYKDFRLATVVGSTVSVFKIALITAVYVAVFDYPAARNIAYPFQQLTRSASIGQIITHVESLFLAFWLIATIIYFAIQVYILAFLFARMMQLDEFEPLILPLAGLALLLGLLPGNISRVMHYRDLLMQNSTAIYLLLPFLLWALDRYRRRVKH